MTAVFILIWSLKTYELLCIDNSCRWTWGFNFYSCAVFAIALVITGDEHFVQSCQQLYPFTVCTQHGFICYKLYKCNIEKNILLHILCHSHSPFFPWRPVHFLESTYLMYRNCAQSAHCRTFPTKTRACSVHMLHTWAVDANMAWANQRRDSNHFTQSQVTLEPGRRRDVINRCAEGSRAARL